MLFSEIGVLLPGSGFAGWMRMRFKASSSWFLVWSLNREQRTKTAHQSFKAWWELAYTPLTPYRKRDIFLIGGIEDVPSGGRGEEEVNQPCLS